MYHQKIVIPRQRARDFAQHASSFKLQAPQNNMSRAIERKDCIAWKNKATLASALEARRTINVIARISVPEFSYICIGMQTGLRDEKSSTMELHRYVKSD